MKITPTKYFFPLLLFFIQLNAMQNNDALFNCSQHSNQTIKKVKLPIKEKDPLNIAVERSFSVETMPILQILVNQYINEKHKDKKLIFAFLVNNEHLFHFDVDKREFCCKHDE